MDPSTAGIYTYGHTLSLHDALPIGKVFIAVTHRGEVEIHEGWLSRKEARCAAKRAASTDADGEAIEAATVARPEVTKAMQNYLELHRQAVVRSEEHTSELQSLMRSSYADFCIRKKKSTSYTETHTLLRN